MEPKKLHHEQLSEDEILDRTPSSARHRREETQASVERFLAEGGQIQEVAPGVSALPDRVDRKTYNKTSYERNMASKRRRAK